MFLLKGDYHSAIFQERKDVCQRVNVKERLNMSVPSDTKRRKAFNLDLDE